ncbi:MAG: MFS transporter [Chloroflexi bacterium]|nr:MFS transporter [Chloroflexota bacterium]MCH8818016.1 MFS transporter [Chloroflexota bacterium]
MTRNPEFRRLWAIGALGGTMRWLDTLVLALVAFDLTGSPFLVSLTFFFRMAPMLFGIGLGIIADRVNRKYFLVIGLVIQAFIAAVMASLLIADVLVYWHLAAGTFLSGIVWASEFPVRRTMIGELVHPERLGRAMSLDSATNAFSRIIGPFAGGVFMATIGPEGAFTLGVVLFISAALVATTLRYTRTESAGSHRGVIADLAEGVRYIRASRLMVGTLVVTLLMNVFAFPYMSLQPIIARETLGVGDVLIGLLNSVEGLGSLLGATLIASFALPRHYSRIYLYGSLLFLVGVLLFSQSSWYWISFIIVFAGGFGMSAFGTMQSTIMVSAASPEMRGRVMGTVAVFIGAGPIGQLNIGIMAGIYDPRTAVMITAIMGLAVMLVATVAFPILRRADSMRIDSRLRAMNSADLRRMAESPGGD